MKHALRLFGLSLLLATPGCAMPSGTEWLIVAGIFLLLFGGAKLPALMRSMGSGINEFKKGLKEGEGGEGGDEGKKEIDSGKE